MVGGVTGDKKRSEFFIVNRFQLPYQSLKSTQVRILNCQGYNNRILNIQFGTYKGRLVDMVCLFWTHSRTLGHE